MERIKRILYDPFQLTDHEWNLISNHILIKKYSKGELLIKQGKPSELSGFLLSGVMRYFCYDSKGNDPTGFFTYEDQYLIDPYSYRRGTLATLNLQALMPCIVGVITSVADEALISAMPRWLDISNKLVLDLSLNFAGQKDLFFMKAGDRYSYFCKHYPTVSGRVPLQYIASYLGIKQPSLSRLRKQKLLR